MISLCVIYDKFSAVAFVEWRESFVASVSRNSQRIIVRRGQSRATKKKVGCDVIEKWRKKMSRRLEIQINYSLKQQTKAAGEIKNKQKLKIEKRINLSSKKSDPTNCSWETSESLISLINQRKQQWVESQPETFFFLIVNILLWHRDLPHILCVWKIRI